ncbi:MAG: hypothetical protein ACYTFT_12595 [Planctomycetota bacterium]|jgi:hypothetical protein
MLTEASVQALSKLRDASMLEWYVVPLIAIAVYVYAVEVERRRWDLVLCGLAFWGMDWLNEIANALILHFSSYAPLWACPGDTAYLIFVGLNAEIVFLFAVSGIVLAKMLPKDPTLRVFGMSNRLFFSIVSSCVFVAVEIVLNRIGMLVWAYPFWNVPHVWLIVIFGYLTFHVVAFRVYDMPSRKSQLLAVGGIWGLAALSVVVFGLGFGWI